jgi:hypothetical protein
MSTYYVNAGSLIEDGLTVDTGYHTVGSLLTAFSGMLSDDDIIYVADNGVVDDSGSVLGGVSTRLTIQAYSSTPTIRLAAIGSNTFNNNLTLIGLKFIGMNAGIYISVYGTTTVTNCVFDRVYLNIVNGSGHYIYNNIFANIADGNNPALTINNNVIDFAVVNNTFYNDAYGIFTQSTSGNGKIYNNIFNNIVDNGIGGGVCILCYNTPDLVTIDYNNFYPDPGRVPTPSYVWWTSGPISIGATFHNYYFGTNNTFTDTKLIDAVNGNFNLDSSSPCVDSGIGHNIEGSTPAEISIPIIDIIGSVRPFNIHTDVGAFEYTDAVTTTTLAPTTTTVAPTTTLAPIVVPVIISQRSIPKVYVGDYVTINLNTLIVTTDKSYPNDFTLAIHEGTGFDIISHTNDLTKIKMTGDKSFGGTTLVPVTVFDGTNSSTIFQYQVFIIAGKIKKSIPVGYNITRNV